MILRRVIKHFRKQEWTAIFLDFLIVVAGILIAFQITEWNETRSARAQEIEYLEALEGDIAYSIGSLERQIVSLERQQEARRQLYEFNRDPGAVVAADELDVLLSYGLFNLQNTNINQVTFEALKSSGRLSLIRSSQLVAELQSLSADYANAMATQADNLQIVYLFSDPLLVNEGDVENLMLAPGIIENEPGNVKVEGKADRVPWIKGSREQSLSTAVIKSPRFKNVVLYRTEVTRNFILQLRRLLEKHKKIAALIDERQAAIGVSP